MYCDCEVVNNNVIIDEIELYLMHVSWLWTEK